MNQWKHIISKVDNKQIVIFGCGVWGNILLNILSKKGYKQIFFFDNNLEKQKEKIGGYEVKKPQKIEADTAYIIAVDNHFIAEEMANDLKNLNIDVSNIFYFNSNVYYDCKKLMSKDEIEEELERMGRETFGPQFNIREPKTFNEIINWEKLHIKDSRRTILADKLLVRDWVAEKIGEKYLNKIYYVFDNENEIDFNKLPEKYVLKVNNGSGRNILVQDSKTINKESVLKQLKIWREDNFAYQSFEMHYKDIKPKIICEKYLDGIAENLYDYNIYCFHGEPKYIECIKACHRPGSRAAFYNKDWEKQEFKFGYPIDPILAPRPKQLDELLELSKILSSDFDHVRVDWYILSTGEIKFGEMTFSSWAGLQKIVPEEYDLKLGQLIKGVM